MSRQRSHLSVVDAPTEDDDYRLKRARKVLIEDVVYCHTHTTVHDDTLDPYREGIPSCLGEGGGYGLTKKDVHRLVYAKYVKGDYYDPSAS